MRESESPQPTNLKAFRVRLSFLTLRRHVFEHVAAIFAPFGTEFCIKFCTRAILPVLQIDVSRCCV
jgi:hypothetical protein